MPSDLNIDDFDATGDDIQLVNEKALTWFDVSCIGTGEMLFTAGFAWIVYIASLYGIKWTIIGFCGGAVVIHCAWWLYREMITAVPEPGSIQSYAREANLFSLGTSYFVGYAPVYGAFIWLELSVAQGLFHALFPTVSNWIWPYLIIAPVVALNLMGNQVTGKVQTILVILTLIGDGVAAIFCWILIANHHDFAANWPSPSPVGLLTPFTVCGLWIGVIVAGFIGKFPVCFRQIRGVRQAGVPFPVAELAGQSIEIFRLPRLRYSIRRKTRGPAGWCGARCRIKGGLPANLAAKILETL